MTATQILPAVVTNPGRGVYVIPRAASVLLAAAVVLVGARELVALWQEVADHVARAGADLGVRCLAGVLERANEAGGPGPQLSGLAALELARDIAAAIRTCLFVLPCVPLATGLAVTLGHGVARSLRERARPATAGGCVLAVA
jgi:hypothetical protein